jgi:hypothetical protein
MDNILIRLDDFSEYSSVRIWGEIIEYANSNDIKLLVGLIPNCQDKELINVHDKVNRLGRDQLWRYARELQRSGHLIFMHGYQHDCKINKYGRYSWTSLGSEFSSTYEIQFETIQKAINLFKINQVKVDGFMPPKHNYNLDTLKVLRHFGIDTITDRYYDSFIINKEFKYIPSRNSRYLKGKRMVSVTLHPDLDWCNDDEFLDSFLTCIYDSKLYMKRNENIEYKNISLNDKLLDIYYRIKLFVFSKLLWFSRNTRSFLVNGY